jgi:hypothetical protein
MAKSRVPGSERHLLNGQKMTSVSGERERRSTEFINAGLEETHLISSLADLVERVAECNRRWEYSYVTLRSKVGHTGASEVIERAVPQVR